MSPQAFNIHTQETAATRPARSLALQTIADFTVRELAHFHWQAANELIGDLQHRIKDYGDETTPFDPGDTVEIEERVAKINKHLAHVVLIARESTDQERARQESEKSAAQQKLLTDGGEK